MTDGLQKKGPARGEAAGLGESSNSGQAIDDAENIIEANLAETQPSAELGRACDLQSIRIYPRNPCAGALAECPLVLEHPGIRADLLALSISGRAVAGPSLLDFLHVESVVFLDGGRFEFARYLRDASGAFPAVIIAARDVDGEIIDVAAIDLKRGLVATWLGVAAVLGAEQIAAGSGPPLLHETALDWLRAGRRGVYVVDSRRAAFHLAGVSITVKRRAFGVEVRRALRLEPMVTVMEVGT